MLSQGLRRRFSSKTILPEYNSHPWQTSDEYTLSLLTIATKARLPQSIIWSHNKILWSLTCKYHLFAHPLSICWSPWTLSKLCSGLGSNGNYPRCGDKESYSVPSDNADLATLLGFRVLSFEILRRARQMVVLLVLLTSLGEHLIVPSGKAVLLTGSSVMEQHSFSDAGLLTRPR